MIPPVKTLIELKDTFRASGLKGVFKKYGWKIFAVFFVYYLIRDLILYVLLPYLIYRGVSGHS